MNAPTNAAIKPSTLKPCIKVEMNQNNTALMIRVKRPKVIMFIGNVSNTRIGLIMRFTIPRIIATINAI
mgnify:FL=1